MAELSSETGATRASIELNRQLKPEGIIRANNKIIRRLGKMLVDYPVAQALLGLGEVENSSDRVATYDSTESGGLDMTKEWGNTVSSLGGAKTLRVQPPATTGILEEAIHMSYGDLPQLEMRISLLNGQQQSRYSSSRVAVGEATRILDRLEAQLALKKRVLMQLDSESPLPSHD